MNRITVTVSILLAFLHMHGPAFADGPAPATQPAREVYIGGEVTRAGVHPLNGDEVPFAAVLRMAPVNDADQDYEIVIRHIIVPKKLEQTTRFNSLKALLEAPEAGFRIRPGDTIFVIAKDK